MGNCAEGNQVQNPKGFSSIKQAMRKQIKNQNTNKKQKQKQKGFTSIKQLINYQQKIKKQSYQNVKDILFKIVQQMLQKVDPEVKDLNSQRQQQQGHNNLTLFQNSNVKLIRNFSREVNDSNKKKKQIKDNEKHLKSIKPYKTFIWEIVSFIKQNQAIIPILSSDFFSYLLEYVQAQYWPDYYEEILAKYLIMYIISISVMNKLSNDRKAQLKVSLRKFPQNYGKVLYKLILDVKQRNIRILKNLQYAQTFLNRQILYEQSDSQKIHKLIPEIQNCQQDSNTTMLLIYSYFVKWCEHEEKRGVSLTQINNTLKNQIKMIRDTLLQRINKNIKNLQGYVPQEFTKITTKKQQNQQAQCLSFNSQNKESGNNQLLDNFLAQLVRQTKKNLGLIIQTTSTICYQNDGFQYQPIIQLDSQIFQEKDNDNRNGSKIKNIQYLVSKASILIQKMNKPTNIKEKSIEELKQNEIKAMQKQMQSILIKVKQIKASSIVTLVIKCSFFRISNLNKAGQKLLNRFQQITKTQKDLSIKIVQVKNRLLEQSTDIVFKVKINTFFIYIRLCLINSELPNSEIIRQLTEVLDSPFFSAITILYQKYKILVCNFFNHAEKVVYNRKNQDAQKQHERIALLKKLFGFNQIINLDKNLNNKIRTNQEINKDAYQQDYQNFNKVKQRIVVRNFNGSSVKGKQHSRLLERNIYKIQQRLPIRTAKCYMQLKKYKKALDQINEYQNQQDPQYLFEIAQIYKNLRYYRLALQKYQTLLQIKKMNLYNEQPQQFQIQVQTLLYNLGNCTLNLKLYDLSMKYFQQLLNCYAKKFGEISKQCGEVYINIGKILSCSGKTQQAIKIYERAINIFEIVEADRNTNYFKLFYLIAQSYANSGQIAQSQNTLYMALQLKQKLSYQDISQSIQFLTNIAKIYNQMGKLQQAELCCTYAVDKAQYLTGSESTQYFYSLLELAALQRDNQQFEKSKFVLTICDTLVKQQVFGKSSYQNIQLKLHYGQLFFQCKDYDNAIKEYDVALTLISKPEFQESPQCLQIHQCKAIIYQKQEKLQQSMKQYQKAARFVKIYGTNSIQKAEVIYFIGKLYYQRKQFEKAQLKFEESIKSMQELQVDYCVQYFTVLEMLTYTYIISRQYELAKKNLDKTVKIYQKYSVKTSDYGQACYLLACLYNQLKQQVETRSLLKKALQTYKYLGNQELVQKVLQQLAELKNIKDMSNIRESIKKDQFKDRNKEKEYNVKQE